MNNVSLDINTWVGSQKHMTTSMTHFESYSLFHGMPNANSRAFLFFMNLKRAVKPQFQRKYAK